MGILVSSNALDNARDIFLALRTNSNSIAVRHAYDVAAKSLLKDTWHSFDDIYVGLYVASLLDRPVKDATAKVEENDLVLKVAFDGEFPNASRDSQFAESLPEEKTIADLMMLRERLEALTPYVLKIQSVSLSDMELRFVLKDSRPPHSDPHRKPPKEIPGLVFESDPWMAFKSRFNVKALDLLPA